MGLASYDLFFFFLSWFFHNVYIGSVKDSVVGEERITQYLLAVLNVRGTPLHWSYLSNRTEVSQYASDGKHEYNIKDLLPKRRKPPNGSDVLYIQVMNLSFCQ